jgi:two-component system sensor histidine kinase ChiS
LILGSALLAGLLAFSCLGNPTASGSTLLAATGWERYPGLLDEAALLTSAPVPTPVTAPLISPVLSSGGIPAGPVTYRLVVQTPDGPGAEYSLSLPGASAFASVIIDGKAMRDTTTGRAAVVSQFLFHTDKQRVSILLQSGPDGPRLEDPGLVPRAILFGRAEDVGTYLLASSGFAVLQAGYFVLGGLFMFLLYLFWRKNKDFVALSLFMFAAGLFAAAKTGGNFGLLDAPRNIVSAGAIVAACLQVLGLSYLLHCIFPAAFRRGLRYAVYALPVAIAAAAVVILAVLRLSGAEVVLYLASSAYYLAFGLAVLAWLAVVTAKGHPMARWFLPAFAIAMASIASHRLFPGSATLSFFLEPLGITVFAFLCMLMQVKKIGDSFESTEALTDYVSNVSTTMKRFIPTEFLECLNKNDVIDLRLGDHVKKKMTIFFSDIRAFTQLSEHLTVEENFNFINSFLSRMVPIVTENGGFVDKYIGDGIMALFEGEKGPDAAIRTAIAMQQKMIEYNGHRAKMGYKSISMGVGIHTGDLMLGVIGVDSRMENTVISDAVNLTSRLQGITKEFNVSLVISEQAFKELEDPGFYKYRFIGKVRVKGKVAPVSVFEIFDGIAPDLFERKMKANTFFEQGMLSYYQKDFGGAMYYFKRVLETIPEDGAAAFYLQHCMNKASL